MAALSAGVVRRATGRQRAEEEKETCAASPYPLPSLTDGQRGGGEPGGVKSQNYGTADL